MTHQLKRSFVLLTGIVALLLSSLGSSAQSKTEQAIAQDFMKFLALQGGRVTRVDKEILPLQRSEVYLNDSLWARVNLTDNNRLLARQGWYGAGPMLKMDYKFNARDFASMKRQLADTTKKEWLPSDFTDSITVLQDKALVPSAFYVFSKPLVFPDKKLVLVKRHFRAEKITARWTALEVYQILKDGKFKLVNTYLRSDK
ncbi:hypothetical protein [Rufibacter sp. LB8]|uniref:hypothetical protein n=1 Tax=Rufibacter sp. LB8 TaxID=2777781 RepID=UPI00178C6B8D|nr:hypothetical protein [Rufibacter sp. LB8]